MLENIKTYFPIFSKYPDLIYLDNAATTQRPKKVLDALNEFNAYENANIHRGVYDLSTVASRKYEESRKKVASFLGSIDPRTIAFTKGTTESINVVANSFVRNRLKEGDNIIVTILEHHANFIPWQRLVKESKVELRIVPIDDRGNLDLESFSNLLDEKTRFISVNHISNTLGTINDIEYIIEKAHSRDVPVMIDAAQSAAFYDLDCKRLNYDFLAFSGHKVFGPFGVGVLYAKENFHNEIQPHNVGGGMVSHVTLEETTFREYPFNMEAGTANVSGVIGLAAAIEFIESFKKEEVREHINDLTQMAMKKLSTIDGLTIIGSPIDQAGIVSFIVEGIHPHDVSSFLNKDHIAVRAGMHCTQPLLDSLETPSTVRASFSIYNDEPELDKLVDSLKELMEFWS